MFLLYRNQGERRYGRDPLAPHPRNAWGFQFILEGCCSFTIQEKNVTREERLTGPLLLFAGPDCVYGWGGRETDVCKVMVFQFDEADYTVRSVIGQCGYRCLKLSESDLPALQGIYDRCNLVRKAPGFATPESRRMSGFFAPLIYTIVSAELTLLFLKHIPRAELGTAPDFGETKVVEALAWYEANLATGPNIGNVAQAVHLSATHLRRLFHKFRGTSPQAAFTRVQFERARWLMRELAIPLERIAEGSGFGSASAFSRAFKAEFKVSPSVYRAKLQKSHGKV